MSMFLVGSVLITKSAFSMQYVTDLCNFFTDDSYKLHSAILGQNEQEVERLLEKDIDPNICYNSSDPYFAIGMRMTPNSMDKAFVPPIILAALTENFEIIKLLSEKGAKLDAKLKIKVKTNPHYHETPMIMEGPTVLQMIAEDFYRRNEEVQQKINSIGEYLILQGASTELFVTSCPTTDEYCRISFDDQGNIGAKMIYKNKEGDKNR